MLQPVTHVWKLKTHFIKTEKKNKNNLQSASTCFQVATIHLKALQVYYREREDNTIEQDKGETMTHSPWLKLLNRCRLTCCHLVSVREAARGRNRVIMQYFILPCGFYLLKHILLKTKKEYTHTQIETYSVRVFKDKGNKVPQCLKSSSLCCLISCVN